MRAYERQSDEKGYESQKAFEAWSIYRDWGSDRTHAKTAAYLGKSIQLIARWAVRWHWTDRMQAVTDWQDMIRMEAVEHAEKEKARSMVARTHKMDEEIMELKELLLPRLKEMADFPISKKTYESADGKQITHVYPAKWSFTTIVKALEALDAGQPEETEGETNSQLASSYDRWADEIEAEYQRRFNSGE